MPVVITWLEMREPPATPPVPAPAGALVVPVQHISLPFYRYLYDRVGAAWRWTDRKGLSDEELAALVQVPGIEIQLLLADGEPAGYYELDHREPVKLAYFGLIPEATGRGLGRFLLDHALRTAWAAQPERVWLHTCTLDSPAALPLYRKAGFVPYRTAESADGSRERLEKQLRFAAEIDALKGVVRRTLRLDRSRCENSAEHSWQLATAALVLAEHSETPVDLLRVLRMALVHDLVEIDAGDTYAYDTAGQATRRQRELLAAHRLFGVLPADQGRLLRDAWEEFEAAETPEARFVHALDRALPLLHNYLTEGLQWREHGVGPEKVRERMAPVRLGSASLADEVDRMIAEAVQRGWL